jgi:Mrp family chromosome partitioning ATPase
VAPQLTVVTGVDSGEESAFCAGNLAALAAKVGSRTLLLDADREGGPLATIAGAGTGPGLADVLRGERPADEVVQRLAEPGGAEVFDFLGLGTTAPETPLLLAGPALLPLLAELRDRYDVIVVNAPPLARVADAAELGGLSDLTLLVATLGVTRAETLRARVDQLRQWGVSAVGLVLAEAGRS